MIKALLGFLKKGALAVARFFGALQTRGFRAVGKEGVDNVRRVGGEFLEQIRVPAPGVVVEETMPRWKSWGVRAGRAVYSIVVTVKNAIGRLFSGIASLFRRGQAKALEPVQVPVNITEGGNYVTPAQEATMVEAMNATLVMPEVTPAQEAYLAKGLAEGRGLVPAAA